MRGYIKKGKPALWKQAADAAGVVDHFAVARQQYKKAKAERNKMEASFGRLPKQRKSVPQVSERERQRREDYRKARAAYLRDCPYCEVCVEINNLNGKPMESWNPNSPPEPLTVWTLPKKEHDATDIHHVRGRAGPLLTDRRFFKSVCREAHNWIHANPSLARALGLLAEPGQWNKPGPSIAHEIAAQETRLLGHQP